MPWNVSPEATWFAVHKRFRAPRQPEGLGYVGSSVAADLSACRQLMRTEDPAFFQR